MRDLKNLVVAFFIIATLIAYLALRSNDYEKTLYEGIIIEKTITIKETFIVFYDSTQKRNIKVCITAEMYNHLSEGQAVSIIMTNQQFKDNGNE